MRISDWSSDVCTSDLSALTVGKNSVVTGYRDHGHMLAYGIDPKVIMSELTGRAAGISRGKGGSMHMFSVEHGFYGGHGLVGAQVPLGAVMGVRMIGTPPGPVIVPEIRAGTSPAQWE